MIFWFLSFLFLLTSSIFAEEKQLIIVICSYNNEQLVEQNLNSILLQTYKKYRVIYRDDCSTDRTAQIVKSFIEQHNLGNNWTLILNKTRNYKLANLYKTIHEHCNNDEIVVEIDGDDWLLDYSAFSMFNEIYQNESVWMTSGGFTTWPNKYDRLTQRPIAQHIIDTHAFRQCYEKEYFFMALRSFYAGLFKQIEKKDLMKDKSFFTIGSDIATMIPMFEMAGDRFHQITQPVYLYNTGTEINDFKRDRYGQKRISKLIQNKPPYQRLESVPF